LALLGSAAAVARPCAVRAQQSSVPTIGFLTSRTPKEAEYLVTALRESLKDAGYIEGQNVGIEYRYAESHNDRLPALAADLVGRQVAVIIAGGTSSPAIAATRRYPSCSRPDTTRWPADLSAVSTGRAAMSPAQDSIPVRSAENRWNI
jgi:ABC-type uncharacterized transport system substrate-binding protein